MSRHEGLTMTLICSNSRASASHNLVNETVHAATPGLLSDRLEAAWRRLRARGRSNVGAHRSEMAFLDPWHEKRST
jgi:hypothetical protein